jgi:hypothetical protein
MAKLPTSPNPIQEKLRAELEGARVFYLQECAHFKSVTEDIPSGLPHPDGVTRIAQAAKRHIHAIDAYKKALKRFGDYAINKTIPDDLKP